MSQGNAWAGEWLSKTHETICPRSGKLAKLLSAVPGAELHEGWGHLQIVLQTSWRLSGSVGEEREGERLKQFKTVDWKRDKWAGT